MRKKILAGNWKMNKNLSESIELAQELKKLVSQDNGVRVIVSPTFTNLYAVNEELKNSNIKVAAQNLNENENGAFTGEISADMIASLGVDTVILGHSERRTYFGESDELLAKKVDQALKYNMNIIFCIGELLDERKTKKHFEIVKKQISNALFNLDAIQFKNIVLAYEPVWAIGTGETATPQQAQEIHAYIREIISKKYGNEIAEKTSILYGGSCKPSNAKEIFSKPDVDGGLIGGAALQANDFYQLIQSF